MGSTPKPPLHADLMHDLLDLHLPCNSCAPRPLHRLGQLPALLRPFAWVSSGGSSKNISFSARAEKYARRASTCINTASSAFRGFFAPLARHALQRRGGRIHLRDVVIVELRSSSFSARRPTWLRWASSPRYLEHRCRTLIVHLHAISSRPASSTEDLATAELLAPCLVIVLANNSRVVLQLLSQAAAGLPRALCPLALAGALCDPRRVGREPRPLAILTAPRMAFDFDTVDSECCSATKHRADRNPSGWRPLPRRVSPVPVCRPCGCGLRRPCPRRRAAQGRSTWRRTRAS